MADGLGAAQIVDNHLGRAQHGVAVPVTALEDFEHGMVGLVRVAAGGNRFVPVRVKGPAEALLGLNAVTAQQLVQLLEGHLYPLAELFGRGGCAGGECAFEVVDDRQQFADELVFLRGSTTVDLLGQTLAVVIEIGGQPQVAVLLFGDLGLKRLGGIVKPDIARWVGVDIEIRSPIGNPPALPERLPKFDL
jgi:hypothetical protein